MPGPLAAAGIAAGANLVGAALGVASTGSMNRKTRKFTKDMYNLQRSHALADWNMVNEYNSPVAQMQRLRDAKLNPHLVYGNGATATSSEVRNTSASNWNPDRYDFSGIGAAAGGGLAAYYDVQLKEAQTDNIRANTTVAGIEAASKMAQTLNTIAQTGKTSVETAKLKEDLRILTATGMDAALAALRRTNTETDISIDRNVREIFMTSSNLREAWERILSSRMGRKEAQARINQLEKDGKIKDFEIYLNSLGLTKSDPAWQRMAATAVGAIGSQVGAARNFDSTVRGAAGMLRRVGKSVRRKK